MFSYIYVERCIFDKSMMQMPMFDDMGMDFKAFFGGIVGQGGWI